MTVTQRPDLAEPGVGTYEELEKCLPVGYRPLLGPRETQLALHQLKRFISDGLCRALNLIPVEVPLIVSGESGINDDLDRDGSRTPVRFPCGLGLEPRLDAQIVQAATRWKRMALRQFECRLGEGILTDMRAVRKDCFLDHDHSAYVDQWDWERVISAPQRNLYDLKATVRKIWGVLKGAEAYIHAEFPKLRSGKEPDLPDELVFLHAEEVFDMYPDLSRRQRETELLQHHPAVFIIGIGADLRDGHPHQLRAADCDDWVTPAVSDDGHLRHGLNGDIVVWNPVTRRRLELSSMGIRVTGETLRMQLELTGQLEALDHPYHQAILHGDIPLSMGGGIGQSRTAMLLLRKAHLGEVSISVWPRQLKTICERKGIKVLE